MENYKMSNAELMTKFEDQLATGSPVVFDVRPNENGKDQHSIYIAQKVQSDPIVEMLQGFSPIITRTVLSVKNDVLQENQEVADTFGTIGAVFEGYNVQFEDSTEQSYPTETPILTKGTDENGNHVLMAVQEDGKDIYRRLKLVLGEANNKKIEPNGKRVYELEAIVAG